MADAYPNPGSDPIRPETDPRPVEEAMRAVHQFYDEATIHDQITMESRLSILSTAVSLEMRPYLQFCTPPDENPPMVCNYYQMALRPHGGSIARNRVYEIIARFPYFSDVEQPFDLPTGVDYWNDVSLDVSYVDGTKGRYWLNSKELTAYKDADSIDVELPHDDNSRDLFKVLPDMRDDTARPLSSSELLMLVRQCEVKTQPNNPEDE